MKIANDIDRMFGQLTFQKTAQEIVQAATKKTEKLRAKIEERQRRVTDLRSTYDIDDAALVQLLQAARKQAGASSFTYTSSASNARVGKPMEEKTIAAGVVNNLLTEGDFIEAEKEQADRLDLICRNLKPLVLHATDAGAAYTRAEFTLTYEELEYLGF